MVPLDVRVTDLPDFEALRGRVETRDRRSWDGIGGLAGDAAGKGLFDGIKSLF